MDRNQRIFYIFFVSYGLFFSYFYFGCDFLSLKKFQYGSSLEWQEVEFENCNCKLLRNCYPSPNSELCGACLDNCWQLENDSTRKQETAFAVAAWPSEANNLYVLLASLLKHYPKSPILVYIMNAKDNAIPKKLYGVKNVQVIKNAKDPEMPLKWTSYLIQDALSRYENVAWVSPKIDFLRGDLDLNAGSWNAPVSFIGRDSEGRVISEGYHKFFPLMSWIPNKPLFVFLKQASAEHLQWISRCGINKECSVCKDADGDVDCTLQILHVLAVQNSNGLDYIFQFKKYFEVQSWNAPECGLSCILTTLVFVFVFVTCVALIALAFFRKTITETHQRLRAANNQSR